MSDVDSAAVYGNISGNRAIDYAWASIIEIYSTALVIGRISDNGAIGYGCGTGITQVNPAALAIIAVAGGNVINDNAICYGWGTVDDVDSTALIPDSPIGDGKPGYKSVI